MKLTKAEEINQFDKAHQDVLSVLDNRPKTQLTNEQIEQIAHHVAGNKNKIYFDYINNLIQEIETLNIENRILDSAFHKIKKKLEGIDTDE